MIAFVWVLSYGQAQAAWLGHTRIVSVAGAPLRVEVPIMGLSDNEAQALRVNLAEPSAWEAAGIKPPVPLSTIHLTVLPAQAQEGKFKRVVLVQSDRAPVESAVDILLDLTLPGAQRQVQVSVLSSPLAPRQLPSVAAKSAPSISKDKAVRGSSKPPGEAPAARKINVQPGDTLIAIARRYQPASTTTAQMLVALWQANQKAFTEENINMLRSPVQLALPNAEAVRAVDPEEARRIVQEHVDAFNEYRARLARGSQTVRSALQGGARPNAGRVTAPQPLAAAKTAPAEDRLRLAQPGAAGAGATGTHDAARADSRTASKNAMNEARARIEILQKNLADIKETVQPDKNTAARSPAQGDVNNNAPAVSSDSQPSSAWDPTVDHADAEFSLQHDRNSGVSTGNDEMRRIVFNGVLGGTAILALVFTAVGILLNRRRGSAIQPAMSASAADNEPPSAPRAAQEKGELVQQ